MDEFTTQEAAVLRGLARHMLEMLATAEKRVKDEYVDAQYSEAHMKAEYQRGYANGYTTYAKAFNQLCQHDNHAGYCEACIRSKVKDIFERAYGDLEKSEIEQPKKI